ncbi:MAG: sensor histidine kinase [Actinophytocola sp.]|uniref:sensor histidine kinase n=1 Tax=Actinophytocola sp. TaxID=1872138 RepID=UPI003D6A507F
METLLRRVSRLPRDRRVVDAVLVVACLALTALAVKTPWATLPRPVIAVAGVLGSLALWPRRRLPHLAAIAGAVAYALSGNPGPALVGLYSAAAFGSRRMIWLPALAGWAGFVAWSWLDAGTLTVADIGYAGVGAGLAVAVGAYAATRAALVASLREQARHAEAERRLREEQARAAERTRIAREMHDVLAHKVSLIALYAGALELHAGGNSRLEQGTTLIRVTAREALLELRSVLGMLRAEAAEELPHNAAAEPFADLASLVEASARAGQPVDLHDDAGSLPPATARVVYRVVQEGLTNAHKHASGAATTVSLARDDASVTVAVVNDAGAAALDLPGSGAGLVGLAERVRLVGGSLRSGPTAAGGWELRATVPWLDQRVDLRLDERDGAR